MALASCFFHLVAVSPQPAACTALPLPQQLPPAALPAGLSPQALRWPKNGPPQQPLTRCLASWPPLRPLNLPSRALPELTLAGGDQKIFLCPPAALPLVRLLASPSLSPLFPNVSLPNLPSLHPFSLSLLPLRHGSFLPGTGRLSSVVPNRQPERLVVLRSAPGP